MYADATGPSSAPKSMRRIVAAIVLGVVLLGIVSLAALWSVRRQERLAREAIIRDVLREAIQGAAEESREAGTFEQDAGRKGHDAVP